MQITDWNEDDSSPEPEPIPIFPRFPYGTQRGERAHCVARSALCANIGSFCSLTFAEPLRPLRGLRYLGEYKSRILLSEIKYIILAAFPPAESMEETRTLVSMTTRITVCADSFGGNQQ